MAQANSTWQLDNGVTLYQELYPLNVFSDFPTGGETRGMTNTPDVIYSTDVIGNNPTYRFDGMEFIQATTAKPPNEATLPCRGVDFNKSYNFFPKAQSNPTMNINGSLGVEHGQGYGLASTPLHPVNNTVTEDAASYYAWKNNLLLDIGA